MDVSAHPLRSWKHTRRGGTAARRGCQDLALAVFASFCLVLFCVFSPCVCVCFNFMYFSISEDLRP